MNTYVAGRRYGGRLATGATPDPELVAAAIAGRPVDLDPASLAEAIRQYDRDGRSAAQVARRLGCTARTVQRHRARRRAARS